MASICGRSVSLKLGFQLQSRASRLRWHGWNMLQPTCAVMQTFPQAVIARSLVADQQLARQSSSRATGIQQPKIAYEIIQGQLVQWSESDASKAGCRPPPTCVLVHGILGSRKNMISFAHRIVQGFPAWQVLVVDLRCHGESAALGSLPGEPHTVVTSASDILSLLRHMKLFPEVLVGHSFGGKVVMSMAEQFSKITSTLPRPVRVWVLDALPGQIRAGDAQRRDHPADLIARLQELRMPIPNRTSLQTYLTGLGFSDHIAKWASTNLRPVNGDPRSLGWGFDLDGIAEMYRSYETSSLWSFLKKPANGISVSFVRAEHSTFRWAGPDQEQIAALNHRIYFLHDAGHWVHTDNPEGLYAIMAPSFGIPELHLQSRQSASANAATH